MEECSGCMQPRIIKTCDICGFDYCDECMIDEDLHQPCEIYQKPIIKPQKNSCRYCCNSDVFITRCENCSSSFCEVCDIELFGYNCPKCLQQNCYFCFQALECCENKE